MEQGFQPFEREFNLPPQPVCTTTAGHFSADSVVPRIINSAAINRARIEHLLFVARLPYSVSRVASTASRGLRKIMRRIGVVTPGRPPAWPTTVPDEHGLSPKEEHQSCQHNHPPAVAWLGIARYSLVKYSVSGAVCVVRHNVWRLQPIMRLPLVRYQSDLKPSTSA